MKKTTSLLKSLVFFSMVILLGCHEPMSESNQDAEDDWEAPTANYVRFQEPLESDSPLLTHLKSSLALEVYDQTKGTPAWNHAQLTQYANDIYAIVVPIYSESKEPKEFLISYFAEGEESNQKTVLMKMELAPEVSSTVGAEEAPFSGKFSFSTTSGTVLLEHQVKDNQIVSREVNMGFLTTQAGKVQSAGWDCFALCLDEVWNSLPGYLQALCGGTATGCISTGNPIPCTAAGVCLSYYGTMCALVCGVILYS